MEYEEQGLGKATKWNWKEKEISGEKKRRAFQTVASNYERAELQDVFSMPCVTCMVKNYRRFICGT
jgi:hypothetical protein